MNVQLQMPENVIVDEVISTDQGIFTLQPLEKGYGVTLGNSLRRVLLSSIPGNAIVGIKITDVLHEFQTITGVVEDVSQVILNLKTLSVKPNDKKSSKVTVSVKGPGQLTGKDIDAAGDIEVLNKDLVICNLEKDAEFEMELRIGRGKGYVPSEEQNTVDFPIGMLPIDAIFTPIKNVIFQVEPYRVGQKTDYEKLILDIKTDGTVSPKEAVHIASKILNDHLKLFSGMDEFEDDEQPEASAEEEIKQAENNRIKKILLTPVDELELSVRAHNCLKAADIKLLGELVKLEEAELLKFRNFGRKSLTELIDVVHNFGLDFGMNIDKYIREELEKFYKDLEQS
ncbi:DNA-directed RNA polymerase subunit alpha [Candidatus Kapabacteria bacterium]|nr:DNA-directed RNA polymerase subunit alpha [Candidatus Kapabacteria bacterium]